MFKIKDLSAVDYNKQNGVATIRLNRPDAFNSMNGEMAKEWLAALEDCKQDKSVRVVLITGNGKAFCAGQDLKEVVNPDSMPGFKRLLEERFNPIVDLIVNMDKPVIAGVNGVAAGAGANLALCCDIVIAKESAKFIQAFSAIGLIPDSAGTYFLPRLVGRARAMAYAMLGEKIGAKRAEQEGMIYKAVADEEFEETISSLATKFSTMATKGLVLTKKAINESFDNSFAEQLSLESTYQIEAAESYDYREGVSSFVEKRKPIFKGE